MTSKRDRHHREKRKENANEEVISGQELLMLLQLQAGDEEPQDLGSPFADGEKPRVPPMPVHVESIRVAVAAMDLDRVIAHPKGRLGGEELGLRDLRYLLFAPFFQHSGIIRQEP